MKKALVGASVVASVVLGVSGVAQAAAGVRLTGTHLTTVRITAHKNFPSDVGKVYKGRKFVFTPKCPTGSCDTVLKRQRNTSNTIVTTTLQASSGGKVYNGTSRYISECVDRNGNVLAAKGYQAVETTALTVTAAVNGVATHYKGTLSLTFTPLTSAPRACTPDSIKASFTS